MLLEEKYSISTTMQDIDQNLEQQLSKNLRIFGRINSDDSLEKVKTLIESYDGVKFIVSNGLKADRLITVYSIHQENPYLSSLQETIHRVNKKKCLVDLHKHSVIYEEQLKNDNTQNSYYITESLNQDSNQQQNKNNYQQKQSQDRQRNGRHRDRNEKQNQKPELSENLITQLQMLGNQIKNKENGNNLSLDQDVEDFLIPSQSETTFSLVTVDFEAFVTHKGNKSIPSEIGMVKIQNGGISGTLHCFFKPETPFTGKDTSLVARTKKLTGIPHKGAPNAIVLTQDNITKTRQSIIEFLGPVNLVLLTAKGIQMENDLLFRYFGIDKAYQLVEFEAVFKATFQADPDFSLIHSSRVFDFCEFHESIQSEEQEFHCALDDAMHLAKLFIEDVEKKKGTNEIEIIVDGKVVISNTSGNDSIQTQSKPKNNKRDHTKQQKSQQRQKQSKQQKSNEINEPSEIINIEIE